MEGWREGGKCEWKKRVREREERKSENKTIGKDERRKQGDIE